MDISAKIISASIGKESGVKIITMEVEQVRCALAEFNTHRVITKNGASSRAVPVKKMIEALRRNHHRPLQWLRNQPGMVATTVMSDEDAAECDHIWSEAMEDAIRHALRLDGLNVSKQYVNRLLEPFMMTRTLATSTKWANFYKLRDEKGALPEFRDLAQKMKEAADKAEFVERSWKEPVGGWHLPFIDPDDFDIARWEVGDGYEPPAIIPTKVPPLTARGLPYANAGLRMKEMRALLTMSAARCCRLSYRTLDNQPSNLAKDTETFLKLATDPLHASPMEHQAFALQSKEQNWLTGNLHGWMQFRKIMPNEAIDEARQ